MVMPQNDISNFFNWGKQTYIMGILNVTPDSFSDGGSYTDLETALQKANRMIQDGAHIIDVGGESTRPGYTMIPQEEEVRRAIPVIKELSKLNKIASTEVLLSIDSYRAKTVEEAIKAGANFINDIWGLKYDPEMANVAAAYDVYVCIMHNRTSGTDYDDIIEDMLHELEESIKIAHKAGVKDDKIILDPGIGFAKTWEQNLVVMRRLAELKKLGYPVLLGVSRKGFIGKVLGLEVQDRLEGTLALTASGIKDGVDIVRVHDVNENARVARMMDSFVR
jgi:dihydropteroate synthase